MADATVDKLKIEIEASAKNAGDSIDKLIEYVGKLRDATGNIETDKLSALSDSLNGLAESMKNMPKASAFNSLAKSIQKVNDADVSKINEVSAALGTLADSVKKLNDSGAGNINLNLKTIAQDNQRVQETTETLTNFEEKIQNVGKGLNISNDIGVVNAEIAKLEARLESLIAKEDRFTAIGGKTDSSSYRGMQYDIAEVSNRLEELYEKQEELEKSAAIQRLSEAMKAASASATNLGGAAQEESEMMERAGGSSSSLAQRLAELQTKWRDLEDSFTAKDIIGGTIYKMNSAVINGVSSMTNSVKSGLSGFASSFQAAAQNAMTSMQSIPNAARTVASSVGPTFQNVGASVKDAFTHPISTAVGAVNSLTSALGNLRSELSGVGSTLSSAFGSLTNVIGAFISTVGSVVKKIGEVSAAVSQWASHMAGTLRSALNTCTNLAKKFGNACKTVASKILSAAKAVKSFTGRLSVLVRGNTGFASLTDLTTKLSNAFEGLSKKIAKVTRLMTFMALRKAITALFTDLGTAIEHLALKSDDFNESLSELMSSISYFSHSVAALAQPLLNIFGPALNYIVTMLAKATAYVNMFLSALTGKSYYTAAIKQTEDYAASLSDAASAAKEIKDATVGIDELNIISQDDNSGSGSSGTDDLEDCYEELAINQKILDLVAQLKEIAAEVFAPMKEAWDDYGQGVVDAFEYALTSCWQLIKDMGQTWLDVWTNGTGYETCKNILLLLTDILNWIGDIATAWDEAWKVKGEDYVQSVFDKLNAILFLIYTISESFRAAWNSGSGQEALEHIYQILTDCNNTITNIANNFKSAWTEGETGNEIAQSLFNAFNAVLGVIEDITTATKEWSEDIDFSSLLTAVQDFTAALEPTIEGLGSILSGFYTNVLLPLGQWTLEEGLPQLVQVFTDLMNEIDWDSLNQKLQEFWEHLEPFAETVGEGLILFIERVAELVANFVDSEAFQSFLEYLEDWMDSVEPEDVADEIQKLVTAFIALKVAIAALEGLSALGNLVNGISKLTALAGPIGTIISTITGFFGTIGEAIALIAGGAGTVSEVLTTMFTPLQGVIAVIAGVVLAVTNFVDQFKNGFNAVKEAIMLVGIALTAVGAVILGVAAAPAAIVAAVVAAVATAVIVIKEHWEEIKTFFSNTVDTIVGFFSGLGEKLAELGSSIWQGLVDGLTNAWETVTTGISNFVSNFVQGFKDLLGIHSPSTEFEDIGGYVVEGLINGITNFASTCAETVQTWASNVVTWFTGGDDEEGIVGKFKNAASDIVSGFTEKLGSTYNTCKDTIQTWAGNVSSWFKEKLDIESPSKVFAEIGKYTVEGYAEGIDDNGESSTKNSITSFASNILQWFTGTGNIGKSAFEGYAAEIVNGFASGITSAASASQSALIAWATKIKEWFTNSGAGAVNAATFNNYAYSIISAFRERIASGYATTKNNMVLWASKTKEWFTNIASYSTFYAVAADVVNGFKNGIGALYTTCKSTIEVWGSSIIKWFKDQLEVASPSKVFYEIGEFAVAGFNTGIAESGNSTSSYINDWVEKFSDFKANIGVKFNIDEQLADYTPNYDTGFNAGTMTRLVQEQINTNSNLRATVDGSGSMRDAIRDVLEEIVGDRLDNIESHTKTQAEKKETTKVYVGDREVAKSVAKQKAANGFSFSTA